MKNHFDLNDDVSGASRSEIGKLQDRLLAEHIRHCRANSPFYRRTLAAFPDRDYDYDSLRELPTTSKSDIAEHNEEFFAVPMREISDICFTSGTTGKPCKIVYTAGDLDRLAVQRSDSHAHAGHGDEIVLSVFTKFHKILLQ